MNFRITNHARLAIVGLLLFAGFTVPLQGEPPADSQAVPPAASTSLINIQLLKSENNRYFIKAAQIPTMQIEAIREQFEKIAWRDVFQVRVANKQATAKLVSPLWGTYRLGQDGILFLPRFPLRPGLKYQVKFDLESLWKKLGIDSSMNTTGLISTDLKIPASTSSPKTRITGIYPSADVLPENLLKFYLEFSGPMSRGDAYEHLTLFDKQGQEVELPFLELDEELWDPGMTRLTLFIDPGRIKRGLRPHEEIGPALINGGTYELVINQSWKDGHRNPLVQSVRKTFRVGPPDYEPIEPKAWKITTPAGGTTSPLIITFPEPLDYGLLQRVLHIEDLRGELLDGVSHVQDGETAWSFTPSTAWQTGEWTLVVDRILEDLAGNSVGRAFDVKIVEVADQYDSRRRGQPVRIEFQIR